MQILYYKDLRTTLLLVFLLLTICLKSQEIDSSIVFQIPSEKQPILIDILSSYYSQDGNNSAVTGGEGTEALKDYASIIKINIPLKKDKNLTVNNGISYFSSASTDNIDPKTISGASKGDFRYALDVSVNKKIEPKNVGYHIDIGGSHQAHFASLNSGFGITKSIPKWQGEFSYSNLFVMDVWGQYYRLSKLFPSDYNGPDDLKTDKRYSLNTNLQYEQIVNDHLKCSFNMEMIQQFGLLSIPYHRIYFSDIESIDIERLPAYKLRIPISTRWSYYAADFIIIKAAYRFYWDNFKLKSHAVSLEIPFKFVQFFTIYPIYRYHYQYGNQYFNYKGKHLSTETFYTSDYDLSDFHSHYFGAGMKWIPFNKHKSNKGRRASFNAIELRGGYYIRSNGFSSWIVSGGLSWTMLKKED